MESIISYILIVLSVLLSLSSHSYSHSSNGFSVEIIHRDSVESPLYDPSQTHSERLANAFRRSISRAATLYSSRLALLATKPNSSVESTVYTNGGEYLMSISLGTPPFKILAIADTGSDLTWTQCRPCKRCYKQVAPLFKPNSSKTYRDASCSSSLCNSASGAKTSCSADNSCHYAVSYGDQSFSNGNIATDVLTLSSTSGRPVTFPNFLIGCSHNSDGTFDENGSGIVGLGGGAGSFVSQLTSSIGGKFSYCLVPFVSGGTGQSKNSSTLNFGGNAVVSGRGVVSTPIVRGDYDTFYYLTLEGMSVGSLNGKNKNKFINFRRSTPEAVSEGNIIIDSGTTLTLVPEDFYSDLEAAVASELKDQKRVDDPSGTLNFCYESTSDASFVVPSITVHFKGADVKLSKLNTFVRVSEEVVCFAIVGTQDLSIYGNLAQMNFLVGYDRVEKTVSFKPTDCTIN